MANPDWTRDEIILALELYLREPAARGSKSHPECLKLSKVLQSLPIHKGKSRDKTFRNANGVGMKLSNFLRYDPTYRGVGLPAGSQLEEEVWNTFSGDLPKLKQIAEAIRAGAKELIEANEEVADDDDEAEEGNIVAAVHKRRERSPTLVRKKKTKVLKESGALKCEVCAFDFAIEYGNHGEGFAECHHDRPLATMKAGDKTKLADLRIVCANCHRMLHRGKPWKSVAELKQLLKRH